MDAPSKAVYPRKASRDRFTAFLSAFSNWEHWDRISLPHLTRLLSLAPAPEFAELRAFAFEIYDKCEFGTPYELDCDPKFDEVKSKWPKGKEHFKPIEGVSLESIRHDHLLYTYRNSLVHELRRLGKGMEMGDDCVPHYQSSISSGGGNTWELVYPAGFFKKLCTESINALAHYLVENRIDPFSFIGTGTFWLNELNS